MCKKNGWNKGTIKDISTKVCRKEICGTFQVMVVDDIQEGGKEKTAN
jgi:hypothetical protein